MLFKYVTAERTDVLAKCRIRFTQPGALNDPFESAPSLTLYKARQVEKKLPDKIVSCKEFGIDPERWTKGLVSASIDNTMATAMDAMSAFLSLSEVPNNLLMWSHYANAHTGFVIGFDESHDFFSPGRHAIPGLLPVEYSDDRCCLPERGFIGLSNDEAERLNLAILCRKSAAWSYEREHRLLALPKNADEVKQAEPPIYLYSFTPDIVLQVIIGCRMLPDDRRRLMDVLAA